MHDMSEIREELYINLLSQLKYNAVLGEKPIELGSHPDNVEYDISPDTQLYYSEWEWYLINGEKLSESSWIAVNHNAPDGESGAYYFSISNDEVLVGALDVNPVVSLQTKAVQRRVELLSQDPLNAVEKIDKEMNRLEEEKLLLEALNDLPYQ